MITASALAAIDLNSMDRSPSRKRARYNSPVQDRWSLTENNILLDEVYDCGVALLVDSDSDCGSDEDRDRRSRNDREQVAVLQATISKEMLTKISQQEWESEIRNIATNDEIVTMNHFEKLSDEMVLHIFNFLPKRDLNTAALVCKRWHRLMQDESLWTRMDLANHQLQAGALGQVFSRQVMILRLAQAEIAEPAILPSSRAFNQDFRSRLLLLDLSMVNTTCDVLVQIFRRCRRLKKISLEHVRVNQEVFAELSLNKDLEVVNLAMTEGINERGLQHLLGNCHNIRELNVAWTYLNSASVQYISSHLPKGLDRFNISGCRKILSNEHVHQLVKCCPNLRELDLSDCTSVTSEAITYLTLLQDLNFLALSRCYQVSYSSLLQLKNIRSLAYLDVHGGYVNTAELRQIQDSLGSQVHINKFKFSSVARPTVGARKSTIWNMRVRDF